jgi:two-component sensor histidine kinase
MSKTGQKDTQIDPNDGQAFSSKLRGGLQAGMLSVTLVWLVFVVLIAAVLLTQISDWRLNSQRQYTAEQYAAMGLAMIADAQTASESRAILRHLQAATPELSFFQLESPGLTLPAELSPGDVYRIESPDGRVLQVVLSATSLGAARLWTTLATLISLGTVFLLMSVFLVVMIGRLVGRPVRQLDKYAAQLASGDTDAKVYIDAAGDFASLAESLELIRTRINSERDRGDSIGEELRRTNSLQSLMLRELNHRIRNNLASLSALVGISQANNSSMSEFSERIDRRISAMAAVHGMLSERNWSPVGLLAMLERLCPVEFGERIRMTGPDIDVSAAQATPLAMVFQEMFANAVEHGSLGSGAGWLQVQWDVGEVSEGQVIVIDWRETGGPPPDANAVAGTGTVLIRGLIEGEMRGDIKLHHAPDGVSHRIRIPLKVMTHLHDV